MRLTMMTRFFHLMHYTELVTNIIHDLQMAFSFPPLLHTVWQNLALSQPFIGFWLARSYSSIGSPVALERRMVELQFRWVFHQVCIHVH